MNLDNVSLTRGLGRDHGFVVVSLWAWVPCGRSTERGKMPWQWCPCRRAAGISRGQSVNSRDVKERRLPFGKGIMEKLEAREW
jgi:hypothetical protein